MKPLVFSSFPFLLGDVRRAVRERIAAEDQEVVHVGDQEPDDPGVSQSGARTRSFCHVARTDADPHVDQGRFVGRRTWHPSR